MGTACGAFCTPGALMVTAPVYVPGVRPDGFTVTNTCVGDVDPGRVPLVVALSHPLPAFVWTAELHASEPLPLLRIPKFALSCAVDPATAAKASGAVLAVSTGLEPE